jgi:hypothetical protein
VDPFLLALQKNYYYPLDPVIMTPHDTNELSSAMQVEPASQAPSLSSAARISSNKPSAKSKVVTVEDSMDVISEPISEIKASEPVQVEINPSPIASPPQKSDNSPIRFSLAQKSQPTSSTSNALPHLRKFFHCLLSLKNVLILPIHNDSKSSIKITHLVNELSVLGAKNFFKAISKPNSKSLAGDYHISTPLTYEELSTHQNIENWLSLHGYYLVLCACQSSDMVRVGFLSRVRSFVWWADLCEMIKSTEAWEENPFQFRLYPGSIACNQKGTSAPVLMVDVERENISSGLAFFCASFDGENPLCRVASHIFSSLFTRTT